MHFTEAKLVSAPLSNLANTILLDIGNSRIKYAPANSLETHDSRTANNIEEILENYPNADKLVFASVRHSELTKHTIEICKQSNIPFTEVTTASSAFGINCAYQQYENLGVDRWLAVLAARTMTLLPTAVIDAGTAITCDFVIENQHIGGWIAPGYTMMRQAVTSNADRVFGNTQRETSLRPGKGTEECVNLGSLALLQGMVHSCIEQLQAYGDDYRIFLCGGDLDMLSDFSNDKIQVKPNLVLQGLKRYL